MRWQTDIELYRARRTLSEVKRILEEALRLSRDQNERNDERTTAAYRHR
jgi:hypothetical protein